MNLLGRVRRVVEKEGLVFGHELTGDGHLKLFGGGVLLTKINRRKKMHSRTERAILLQVRKQLEAAKGER